MVIAWRKGFTDQYELSFGIKQGFIFLEPIAFFGRKYQLIVYFGQNKILKGVVQRFFR